VEEALLAEVEAPLVVAEVDLEDVVEAVAVEDVLTKALLPRLLVSVSAVTTALLCRVLTNN
jgi:hypothetical protein